MQELYFYYKHFICNLFTKNKRSTSAYVMQSLLTGIFIMGIPLITLANNPFLKQDVTISGIVKDESKEPLAGVGVKVKGSNVAAVTNLQGKFSIKVPNDKATLIFTFIGYVTKEEELKGRKNLEITLKEDHKMLDEVKVVNIGYGTVSKERLAGAVSSVGAKDIADFPVTTAAEALAGKLAGVSVAATEGAPGANIQILVRGGTSITQDNNPLYVVDGIPLDNALSIISPNEIESIDVLKDLASTSIYGSRGANGVVLITTKSGRKGRTIVSFETYAGVRKITNYLDMLEPYEYVMKQYEQNRMHWNGYLSTDTGAVNGFYRRYGEYSDLEIYKSYPVVNWQERVFGNKALSNTQVLTLTGGTNSSTFNFSLNRADETGIMLNSGLGRTLASFRFDTDVSKKVKIGINLRYSNQKVYGSGTSVKGSNGGLQNSARFQPYQGMSNLELIDDGAIFENRIDLSDPTTAATRDQRFDVNDDLISSAYFNWNISNKFTFRSNIGYRAGKTDYKDFKGVVIYEQSQFSNFNTYKDQPQINLRKQQRENFNNSNTLSYRTTINKDHRIDALAGMEVNQSDEDRVSQNIRWFPSTVSWESAFANIQQANPPKGAIQSPSSSDVSGERSFSFFGRAMYSYKSRYNLNFSIRHDGSSKFALENRWATFPSAQFAWRLSEEKFFKNLKQTWIDNLKFRLSYGTAGNNRVSVDRLYATIFTTDPSQGGYAETDNSQSPGIYSANLANHKLKWETTVSRNLGLDFDLFNQRFSASVDVYSNITEDLLLNTNIPQQTGYNQQYQNIGSTLNKGLEVQLSGQIVKNQNFSYNASFNISFNRNKIRALQQDGESTYRYAVSSGWGASGEDYLVEVGKPVGQYYGYVNDGLYTLDDFDRTAYESNGQWVLKAGVPSNATILGQGVIPGVMKMKDLNGDNVISAEDRRIIGQYEAKFFGGFNNQFTFKNFDASIFVNYSYGGQVYNANTIYLGSKYQVNGNNFLEKFSNSWRYFNAQGDFMTDWEEIAKTNEGITQYATTNGPPLPYSDAIEDRSFLRITNVTLGYTLPDKLLSKFGVTKLRVYGTINNLYTFTNYSGFDPEASTRHSPLTPGLDYSAYPRSRYILAGLNLTF